MDKNFDRQFGPQDYGTLLFHHNTERELTAVPDDLQDKYIPKLKAMFGRMEKMFNSVAALPHPEDDEYFVQEREEYLEDIDALYTDFLQAGGTREQWNILAPAVHHGHFGEVFKP